MAYRIRMATLDDADLDTLIRQRIAMFTDMGRTVDAARLGSEFRQWLLETMPTGAYRAWIAETAEGKVAGGGGATIIPWPPGPEYMGHKLAFVYNVYTEPAHRRRGLARQVMAALHAWCREHGVTSIALNASRDGQPLYEALGYVVTPSPMMFFALAGV
jgi:GNAT superfamily N-acetyltransferase